MQLDPTPTIKHQRVADSFKSKVKIIGKTHNDGTTNKVEIVVPLKYLSNFWITLEMPLVTCEIYLNLTRSTIYVITNSKGIGTFAIIDTKLYIPVVTLSTQDYENILQQLKSGFKRTIKRNKYLSKKSLERPKKPYLNYLAESSFQEVIVFLFYHLKMMHTKQDTIFDQPTINYQIRYDNTKNCKWRRR